MIDHCIGIGTTKFSQFYVTREVVYYQYILWTIVRTQASQFQFAAMEVVEIL